MFNKIESEEHALEVMGVTPDFEKFKALGLPEGYAESVYNGVVTELICEANNKINGDWKPDWSDDGQWKYNSAHLVEADATKPAGFGLAAASFDAWDSIAFVGERLLVGSSEQAIYLGEKFKHRFEAARIVYKR